MTLISWTDADGRESQIDLPITPVEVKVDGRVIEMESKPEIKIKKALCDTCKHNSEHSSVNCPLWSWSYENAKCQYKPEPEPKLSETIQRGDGIRVNTYEGDGVAVVLAVDNTNREITTQESVTGSLRIIDFHELDSRFNLVSRDADKPLHERIVLGKSKLKWPNGDIDMARSLFETERAGEWMVMGYKARAEYENRLELVEE